AGGCPGPVAVFPCRLFSSGVQGKDARGGRGMDQHTSPGRLPARLALLLAVGLAVGGRCRAGGREAAPPAGPGPGMTYDYLLGQARKHFDARRRAVAALKTPEDVRRRQKELRERFLESLGGFPAKTPLNGRVVGTLRGEGFRVERVIYESR